jgi:acetyl/propionyl-CoA carboxylase alpha subunit
VKPIERLLVANRAEIAARVLRTARSHGCSTVAVFSDADAQLPYVALADDAVRLVGTAAADTYLRVDLLLDAAERTGADAVHPGYGFLSEHSGFAAACEDRGLCFVGPPSKVIASMGSKVEAKALMAAAGVPVLPGATVAADADDAVLRSLAEPVGYPLLIKASMGGGGRGMRIVHGPDELAAAVASAGAEALSAFGDGTVFFERLVVDPRHVEVQVLGDTHGTVVHLFERECSIQRRHQKVLEESPSPGISAATRTAICEAAVAAARAIGYVNAGTVEFVVDADERFSFLEVNTRLQVEHPVTELVTGLDLVELQLQVAEGRPLPNEVTTVTPHGHAIEVRLYAEDPNQDFLPTSGRLDRFEFDDDAVRVDAGYASGSVVPSAYDAMLAKVIAWAPTRAQAAACLATALRTARIHGVTTNRDLLVGVLSEAEFLEGRTDTGYFGRHLPAELVASTIDARSPLACVLAALFERNESHRRSPQPPSVPPGWRNVGPPDQPRRYALGPSTHEVRLVERHGELDATLDGARVDVANVVVTTSGVRAELDGRLVHMDVACVGTTIYLDGTLGPIVLREEVRLAEPTAEDRPGSLHAPLPGTVRSVAVSVGDHVDRGDLLVVLEAMKMEHSIRASHAGIVATVAVAAGNQVESGDTLVVVVDAGDGET